MCVWPIRPDDPATVRQRLVLVFAAVTSMVAIAFVVPLCVLVRDVARERALDGADRDASALFPVLAVTDDADALAVAVSRTPAGSNGRLRIYERTEGQPICKEFSMEERESDSAIRVLEQRARHVEVDVGVGDMLIFDASRHIHRVTTVEGERARWTMGCFVGAFDDGSLVCWS